MYRIYCDGIEFGRDYTLEDARRVMATYKRWFPNCRYYIRKAYRPRISMLVAR
jgi:hypothetical protein